MRPRPQLSVSLLSVIIVLMSVVSMDGQWRGASYAVVIGVDHYKTPTWPTLKYAVRDAQAIAAFLGTQGFQVSTLYESQATKVQILSLLQRVAHRLLKGDRVLVFFAGHGHTETFGDVEVGSIVPYDGTDESATYVEMTELHDMSVKMEYAVHQLFVMDSCYSGSLATRTLGGRSRGATESDSEYLKSITTRVARQYLAAGGRDQEVTDGGAKGHSQFTDAFLEAVQDGKADSNGDGFVTFPELVAYVGQRASNRYQTPMGGNLPRHGGGEFVFRAQEPGPSSGEPDPNTSAGAARRRISLPGAKTGSEQSAASEADKVSVGVPARPTSEEILLTIERLDAAYNAGDSVAVLSIYPSDRVAANVDSFSRVSSSRFRRSSKCEPADVRDADHADVACTVLSTPMTRAPQLSELKLKLPAGVRPAPPAPSVARDLYHLKRQGESWIIESHNRIY